MIFMTLFRYNLLLAQMMPADGDDGMGQAPAPAAAPQGHGLSFSDLQRGLRTANHGDPADRRFQFALCAMVVIVILIGVLLRYRERRKEPEPPNSPRRLAWELSRKVHFPLDTRLFLAWAAHTVKVPMANLMISDGAYERAIEAWVHQPTFSPIRRWGRGRLLKVKPLLFG